MNNAIAAAIAILASSLLATARAAPREDDVRVTVSDHYVTVTSTAPGHAGREARLYVREVAAAGAAARDAAKNGVVLFVHGFGTPAEVAFDVPYKDYSWMAYLARSGFDAFAVDMIGYGRSTRPAALNDPCNLSKAQQAAFIPSMLAAPCAPSHPTPITTIASDLDDLAAVVDHLRALRGVDKVSIVTWSQGAARAVGYAARNPEKVARLVMLAPPYVRTSALDAPSPLAAGDGSMTASSLASFRSNWDRQVGCPGQYEPEASAAVWSEMIASDPVGATWKPAVRRAPIMALWGFNQAGVAKVRTPALMVTGEHDKQVAPAQVHDLYADYGGRQKLVIELACSSHSAMWEKNRLLLFKASRDWLRDGRVDGRSEGRMQLGFDAALAHALKRAGLPLERGLAASAREGTPISAKYELLEDDKADELRISVYTMKASRFAKVIVDHATGKIAAVVPINGGEDLEAAKKQGKAMARAKRSLEAATVQAVRAHRGYRAVSLMPDFMEGRPYAKVILVNGSEWKTVYEALD